MLIVTIRLLIWIGIPLAFFGTAAFLSRVKHTSPGEFGFWELILAFLGCVISLSQMLTNNNNLWIYSMAGSLFLAIRGFDNIGACIKDPARKQRWNSWMKGETTELPPPKTESDNLTGA